MILSSFVLAVLRPLMSAASLIFFHVKLTLYYLLLRYYQKVASSNTSRLEAHAGFFRLLMKGISDPNVL